MSEVAGNAGVPVATIYKIGAKLEADGFKFKVDAERIKRVQAHLDVVARLPGIHLREVRLDTSPIVGVPDQGGTGDNVVLDMDTRTISVVDLKDGFRLVYVNFADPDEHNEQCLEYGSAAMRQFDYVCDWEFLKVAISQPKMGHYDERTYTRAEVEAWVEKIRPLEQRAHQLWLTGTNEEIEAAKTPSAKACEWCPLSGNCTAQTRGVLDMFPTVPVPHDPPALSQIPVPGLSDDLLALAYGKLDEIATWMKAIAAEALRRGSDGTLPGWKMVTGRKGNRKFTDAAKAKEIAVAAIGDAALTEPTLLGIPALQTAMKSEHPAEWELLEGLITQSDGSPTMVRDYDKRPALPPITVEFAPVVDNEELA